MLSAAPPANFREITGSGGRFRFEDSPDCPSRGEEESPQQPTFTNVPNHQFQAQMLSAAVESQTTMAR
jgi:hypothetical protein